jgi:hypothetical protein
MLQPFDGWNVDLVGRIIRRDTDAAATFNRGSIATVVVPGRPFIDLTPGCLSLMSCLPPSAFSGARNFREA